MVCLSYVLLRGPGPQPRHVPRLGIEPATLWSQAPAQSTEPHQPGLNSGFINKKLVHIVRRKLPWSNHMHMFYLHLLELQINKRSAKWNLPEAAALLLGRVQKAQRESLEGQGLPRQQGRRCRGAAVQAQRGRGLPSLVRAAQAPPRTSICSRSAAQTLSGPWGPRAAKALELN